MEQTRYFLLFRRERRVQVVDGSSLLEDGTIPSTLRSDRTAYRRVADEDDFFFWDELRDDSNRTIGFTFFLPESQTLRHSRWITDSTKVAVENGEVRLTLEPCPTPRWECIQGFSSFVYCSTTDERDCVILMFDWSQNEIAFRLGALSE